MFLKTLTIFLLMTCPLWGQLTVDTRTAIQVSGLDDAEKIGEAIFVASDTTVVKLPVVLVTATTEAANITFEVSDKDRNPVDFDQLTASTIVISKKGQLWIRIVAIDFEKNLYATKLVQIDNDSPDLPDPPDPLPPNGPFDSLAKRVAKVSQSMSELERSEIIVLLDSAVEKMDIYEFRTLEQVRDYVEKNWSKSESAKKLKDLLISDSKDRLLSWQQAQEYYLEIVKGLK
jgi:hypothetical protein